MLINKILSVLTLTLMPVANVSTVIASHDNKDDNTNMSDTLKLSSSLSLSNSSVSDADSDNNSDDEQKEENSYKTTVITKEQQKPFDCDESIIEAKSEEESSSEEHVFEEMINTIDSHSSSTNTENQHQYKCTSQARILSCLALPLITFLQLFHAL